LNFTAYFSHLLNGPKLSTVTLLIKVHSLEHTTSSCLYQVVTINSSLVPTISKYLQHSKACSTRVSTKSEYLPDPYSYIIRLATVAIHLNVQIPTVTEYLQHQYTYSIGVHTVSMHLQYTIIYGI